MSSSGGGGGDSKAPKADLLNLRVVAQDGQVVQFKIKVTTPLRKLMHAFCDRQRIVQNTVRFVFDGERVKDTDTPKGLEMEEGDTIEVFSHQTGGGGGGGGGRRRRRRRGRQEEKGR